MYLTFSCQVLESSVLRKKDMMEIEYVEIKMRTRKGSLYKRWTAIASDTVFLDCADLALRWNK